MAGADPRCAQGATRILFGGRGGDKKNLNVGLFAPSSLALLPVESFRLTYTLPSARCQGS